MSKKRYMDVQELEKFLWFLQSKSDDVYEQETEEAVKRFLEKIEKEGNNE